MLISNGPIFRGPGYAPRAPGHFPRSFVGGPPRPHYYRLQWVDCRGGFQYRPRYSSRHKPYVRPQYGFNQYTSNEYAFQKPFNRIKPDVRFVNCARPETSSVNEYNYGSSKYAYEKKPYVSKKHGPRLNFRGRRTEERRHQNPEGDIYYSDSSNVDVVWENREVNPKQYKKKSIPNRRFDSDKKLEEESSSDDEPNTVGRKQSYRQTFGESSQRNDKMTSHNEKPYTDEEMDVSGSSSEDVNSSDCPELGTSSSRSDERPHIRSRSPSRWSNDSSRSPDRYARKVTNPKQRRLHSKGRRDGSPHRSASSMSGRKSQPGGSHEARPGNSRSKPIARDPNERSPRTSRRRRRSRSLTKRWPRSCGPVELDGSHISGSRSNDGNYNQKASTSNERSYQRSERYDRNACTSSASPYQRSESYEGRASTSSGRSYQRSERYERRASTSNERQHKRSKRYDNRRSTSNEWSHKRSEKYDRNASTSTERSRQRSERYDKKASSSSERPRQRSEKYGRRTSTSNERPYQRQKSYEGRASTSTEGLYQRSDNRDEVASTSTEGLYQRSDNRDEVASTSTEGLYQRSDNRDEVASPSYEKPRQRQERNIKSEIPDEEQSSTSGEGEVDTAVEEETENTSNNAVDENVETSSVDIPSRSNSPVPERAGAQQEGGNTRFQLTNIQITGYYPIIERNVCVAAVPTYTVQICGTLAHSYETNVVPHDVPQVPSPPQSPPLAPSFEEPEDEIEEPTENENSIQVEETSSSPEVEFLESIMSARKSRNKSSKESKEDGSKNKPKVQADLERTPAIGEPSTSKSQQGEVQRNEEAEVNLQASEESEEVEELISSDGEGRTLPNFPYVPVNLLGRIKKYRNPQPRVGVDNVPLVQGPNGLPIHFSSKGLLIPYDLEGRRIPIGPDGAYLPVDMAGRIFPHLKTDDGEIVPIHRCEEGVIRTPELIPVREAHPTTLPVSIDGTYIQLDASSRPLEPCENIPGRPPLVVNQDTGIPSPRHELRVLAGKTYLDELEKEEQEAGQRVKSSSKAVTEPDLVSDGEERTSIYSKSTDNESASSDGHPKPCATVSNPAQAHPTGPIRQEIKDFIVDNLFSDEVADAPKTETHSESRPLRKRLNLSLVWEPGKRSNLGECSARNMRYNYPFTGVRREDRDATPGNVSRRRRGSEPQTPVRVDFGAQWGTTTDVTVDLNLIVARLRREILSLQTSYSSILAMYQKIMGQRNNDTKDGK